MKIYIAQTAGFCMGVRRAVDMALEAARLHAKPIYTFGPLIHNPQVLALLETKKIKVLRDIPPEGRGTVLIRAHGVPPVTKQKLAQAGFTVLDATCPRVIKVQTIIDRHAAQGYASIIVGDKDHPEVIGLLGYARNNGHVVGSIEELEALPGLTPSIIVAQTTQNKALFERLKQWVGQYRSHYKVFDTICDSTGKRQAEVKHLAEQADAVVVVGGFNSGNTTRLVEIARNSGALAFHIETEADLDLNRLAQTQSVAITAGASTPDWIIQRVYEVVKASVPLCKA